MHSLELLSIRPGIELVAQKDGRCSLRGSRLGLELGWLSPGLKTALDTLAGGGASAQRLLDVAEERDGFMARPQLEFILEALGTRALLCRTLQLGGTPLATLFPSPALVAGRSLASARYVLSRFACWRREEARLVVEAPVSGCKVVLHDSRAAALLAGLAAPRTRQELAASGLGFPEDVLGALLGLFLDAQVLQPVGENGQCEEDEEALLGWELHDLLFHQRSRLGRQERPYGGTYRFEGRVEPLPNLKARMSDRVVPLPIPDLERLEREDPPFAAVVEKRRSIRAYGQQPITLAQLGEFLYRAARSRGVLLTEHGELGDRPYPAGGALYELELYLAVDRCEGLESGLYQYRPGAHELCQLSGRTPHVAQLLESAWYTLARQGRPHILFVLAARFSRVYWKYESMGYALILKDVGVLYQSMYLAATAMGLAPCALGGGDSELFAQASGLPALVEGSVGEFVLGTSAESAEEENV
jgi:SagB-type dehydrogenase family enzyme